MCVDFSPNDNFVVSGVLKGFDKLDNLVLDECVEYIRGIYLYFILMH